MTCESKWRDLESNDPERRFDAARRLAQCESPDSSAILPLIGVLDGAYEEELFGWVESALEKAKPQPEQIGALAALIGEYLAGQRKPEVAYWSATMLGKAGGGDSTSLDALAELLQRGYDPNVQARAAWAIGEIGASARKLLPYLKAAAGNTASPKLAAFAQHAIEQVE